LGVGFASAAAHGAASSRLPALPAGWRRHDQRSSPSQQHSRRTQQATPPPEVPQGPWPEQCCLLALTPLLPALARGPGAAGSRASRKPQGHGTWRNAPGAQCSPLLGSNEKRKGPFSYVNASSELQPGPPVNHKTKGSCLASRSEVASSQYSMCGAWLCSFWSTRTYLHHMPAQQ
jgi:hypothetical protein